MAKKSKLLAALDAHKGRDYATEKRKSQVKAAEKRKRQKVEKADDDGTAEPITEADTVLKNGNKSEEQDFETFSDDAMEVSHGEEGGEDEDGEGQGRRELLHA